MPTTNQPAIAELIRELRERLGLSQEKFANQLGVSFKTVNRWENGHAKPLPMAQKLIEQKLRSLGERGADLLTKYFPD